MNTLVAGMRKIAVGPLPGRALGYLGRALAHGGVSGGALIGGALGAGAGALSAPEGSSTFERIGRAGQMGMAGAAIGGGIGTVARKARDIQLLNPGLHGAGSLAKATLGELRTDVANVAKRQLHGLTGYADEAAQDAMNLRGRIPAQREAHLAKLRGIDQGHTAEQIKETVDPILARGAQGEAARRAGITTVPGTIRGMWKDPKGTARALYDDILPSGTTTKEKLLTGLGYVGLPVGMAGMDIARGDESEQGGRTLGRKILGHTANIAGSALTAGLPIGSGMLAQEVVNRLAGG